MLESPSAICRLGYDHHLPAAPSPPSRQPSFSPPSLFLNRPSALACWENYFTPSCRPPSCSSAVFLPNAAAATTAAARPSSTTIHRLLLLSPHNLTHSLLPLSLPLTLPAGVLILGRVSTTPPLQQPRSAHPVARLALPVASAAVLYTLLGLLPGCPFAPATSNWPPGTFFSLLLHLAPVARCFFLSSLCISHVLDLPSR